LSSRRQHYFYNEKQLRDEAAAEVAMQQGQLSAEEAKDPAAPTGTGTGTGRKRKNLNPDERLEQSRNRNREHAKNTRLRKKAYVTKLQALAEKMRKQKDYEASERRALGKRIYESLLERKNALHLFLTYVFILFYYCSSFFSFLSWSLCLSYPYIAACPHSMTPHDI
jgi:hypothetical protein